MHIYISVFVDFIWFILYRLQFCKCRHTDAMIEKLKKAGLGYNVGEKDTKDKFGKSTYFK